MDKVQGAIDEPPLHFYSRSGDFRIVSANSSLGEREVETSASVILGGAFQTSRVHLHYGPIAKEDQLASVLSFPPKIPGCPVLTSALFEAERPDDACLIWGSIEANFFKGDFFACYSISNGDFIRFHGRGIRIENCVTIDLV